MNVNLKLSFHDVFDPLEWDGGLPESVDSVGGVGEPVGVVREFHSTSSVQQEVDFRVWYLYIHSGGGSPFKSVTRACKLFRLGFFNLNYSNH